MQAATDLDRSDSDLACVEDAANDDRCKRCTAEDSKETSDHASTLRRGGLTAQHLMSEGPVRRGSQR